MFASASTPSAPSTSADRKPSAEQQQVIDLVKSGASVLVTSVAGSGKTTTVLHLAKANPDKLILFLTYNKHLQVETERRAKGQSTGLQMYTFHGYFKGFYMQKTQRDDLPTDKEITAELRSGRLARCPRRYDVVVIDEAQDVTDVYYELAIRILADADAANGNAITGNSTRAGHGEPTPLVLLGDYWQCVYFFNRSDWRYMHFAATSDAFQPLQPGLPRRSFEEVRLTKSFRLRREVALFVNRCLHPHESKGESRHFIESAEQHAGREVVAPTSERYPVRYIFGNVFEKSRLLSNPIAREVVFLREKRSGIKDGDVFVLGPTTKKGSVLQCAANLLSKKYLVHIQQDEERLDEKAIKGKIVFCTHYRAKGLERKAVIVSNFDGSYFRYYKKDYNPWTCPNELHVACTRASEFLSLVHHKDADSRQGKADPFLPFLLSTSDGSSSSEVLDRLRLYCYRVDPPSSGTVIKPFREAAEASGGNQNATDIQSLCRNIHHEPMARICSLLPAHEEMHAPAKKNPQGHESAPDFPVLATMKNGHQEWVARISILAALKYYFGSGIGSGTSGPVAECLEAAVARLKESSGYEHFQHQVDNERGWLTEALLQRARTFFEQAVFTGDLVCNSSDFPDAFEGLAPIGGRKLAAYPDVVCEDQKAVVLLKYAKTSGSKFTDADRLELASCAYVHGQGGNWRYFMVNVRSGERIRLQAEPAVLRKVVSDLVRMHYGRGWQRSDQEFLDRVESIRETAARLRCQSSSRMEQHESGQAQSNRKRGNPLCDSVYPSNSTREGKKQCLGGSSGGVCDAGAQAQAGGGEQQRPKLQTARWRWTEERTRAFLKAVDENKRPGGRVNWDQLLSKVNDLEQYPELKGVTKTQLNEKWKAHGKQSL